MRKLAIFTAGRAGQILQKKYSPEQVECFIDNDNTKQGTCINNAPVMSLEDFLTSRSTAQIIIPSWEYIPSVAAQIENAGIMDWDFKNAFFDPSYPSDMLVINPYNEKHTGLHSEIEFNADLINNRQLQEAQIIYARMLARTKPIFNHIEIETYNRCNGSCDFCPVSKLRDKRPETFMSQKLFYNIIDQLRDMDYRGRLSLFSNNEPFLDERIIDFQAYARKRLPNAYMQLLTNGTLLSLDKFKSIIDDLDYLIIDNYNDRLELNKTSKIIKSYCEEHKELIEKVTIVIRNPREILTSRGGEAPNRKDMKSYPNAACCLPFRQLIIRPDGKVSMCCNDPLGKTAMGDLTKVSIMDVWQNEQFQTIINSLLDGRKNIEHCKFCDTFYFF